MNSVEYSLRATPTTSTVRYSDLGHLVCAFNKMSAITGDPENGATETTPLVNTFKPEGVDDVKVQIISITEEVIDTIKLGAPIFIAMVSWVGVRISKIKHLSL